MNTIQLAIVIMVFTAPLPIITGIWAVKHKLWAAKGVTKMSIRKWCVVPMAFISANLFAADYIKIEYDVNKAKNCSVVAKYYGGSEL
jgi:hypothetical protein